MFVLFWWAFYSIILFWKLCIYVTGQTENSSASSFCYASVNLRSGIIYLFFFCFFASLADYRAWSQATTGSPSSKYEHLAVSSCSHIFSWQGPLHDFWTLHMIKNNLLMTWINLETCIPANFFWDISVRLLSWECWDFWRRHDYFRRFPAKKSEVFRRRPKSPEG